MMDAIALVLWSSLILIGMQSKPEWLDKASRSAAVFAGAGLLAVIILPHTGDLCGAVIRRFPLPRRIREMLLHFAEQILLGLKTFHDVKRFAAFTGFTAVIWAIDATAAMVGARALDIDLPLSGAALLMCGLGLGSALPSTPGYVGIYQFVTVQVLTVFHASKDTALAYSFVSQVVGYLVVLAFGLPGLYRFRDWRKAAAKV
jgi:uncharacterized membrane protein YbhN (UPF0104 family)